MEKTSVIEAIDVSKRYRIWETPAARLKWSALQTLRKTAPTDSWWDQRLSKTCASYYRDFYALQNVSLTVKPGESVGIMGRNGSGKSTLLQIIAGTLRPTEGHAQTRGRIGALLELGSGFNPEFTGRENVYLNAALLGLSREETHEKFAQIESFADIGDFIDQPVKTYSSGMVVRLGFSVQTVIEPEVLIVDEALAVGDESFQRKCFRRLLDLKDRGMSLLFVSHAAPQVIELCDRALLLVNGKVSCEGEPKQVVNEYHRQIYGAEAADGRRPSKIPSRQKSAPATGNWQATVLNREARSDESHEAAFPKNSAIHSYPAVGARLSLPWIENSAGEVVNHLTRGQTYHYNYVAEFETDLSGVRFGAMIKTTTGLELAGMTSHRATERIAQVAAGTRCRVRFTFECQLLPGAYFINAGLLAVDGEGKEYFAHRLVDACMFRVIYEPDLPVNGTIDLLNRVEIDFNPADTTPPPVFP